MGPRLKLTSFLTPTGVANRSSMLRSLDARRVSVAKAREQSVGKINRRQFLAQLSLGSLGADFAKAHRATNGKRCCDPNILLIATRGTLPIGSGLALPLEERFPRWDATRGPPAGVVVLGGGVIKSEISAVRGEIAVGDTADRIIAAVELTRRYLSARIVFVGRHEADFAIRFFERLGLPGDKIVVERKSRNTIENATF